MSHRNTHARRPYEFAKVAGVSGWKPFIPATPDNPAEAQANRERCARKRKRQRKPIWPQKGA